MRLLRITIIMSLIAPLSFALGCGDDEGDHEPYDTFQACFDDHNKVESFGVGDSIKICCIDHPIGNPPAAANTVCGESESACQTYLASNLAAADATATQIMAACAGYITDRTK